MPTRRTILLTAVLAVPAALLAQTLGPTLAAPLATPPPDARIAHALTTISAERVQADIAKLVGFGTRNTLSSMDTTLPAGQGILPAADWIEGQFRAISADCGGCLEVKRDDFTEPAGTGAGSRIPVPTRLVNVYAILRGTSPDKAAPWVLVTGHYDSRATDVMNAKLTSPGANDDASGVAVSLETARALSLAQKGGLQLPGTIVFVAVAGEEQGLNGSRHLAKLAKDEGWPLEAVLDNDIVGGDTTPGDTMQDKHAVRVFSESVPPTATPEQAKAMLALGAENDSPSRELARSIAELAPAYFAPTQQPVGGAASPGVPHSHAILLVPAFHPVLIQRRDRYLRGGDHTSFNAEGFTAVRFTEWRENFDHQHQTLKADGGQQDGDLLQFVDFDYVVHVAQLNAAVLGTLAAAPSPPQRVRVLTKNLDNNTELAWDAAAFAPPGTTYQVLWRDTDTNLWQYAQSVGTATTVTLNLSKDNVLFGVRAIDATGHASLPVPPVPAR